MHILDRIEQIGNRLPHPATLFLIGLGLVIALSCLASLLGWTIIHPVTDEPLVANNLASSAGVWWLLSHLVENFIKFPPLAIVLVGMLGIGMAERTGLLAATLRYLVVRIPPAWLTPATLFLGIMSSIAVDAGYVVLPPVAAVLYMAAGRSPLTGIAVAFAGVSSGFSANLFITALEPLLAGFTQSGATLIVPEYQVAVTANWWFMIASTFVLTLTGWWVTVRWVEPMSSRYTITSGRQEPVLGEQLAESENKALRQALLALLVTFAVFLLCILLPGAPLHGEGVRFSRWIEATVPLLFLIFVIPGVVFGISVGYIKNDKDAAHLMGDTLA
ncbi:MAG TPA: AbgT family transporter, partial [Nitrosomonas halophila]|nr:AbgT family transporter [Nitrosomonas halophila]